MLGQSIKAVDALVAALGHTEDDLVFQQVHAGGGVHEVQTVGVYVGRSGDVQLVHLLLTGREEEVAVSALLDLGLESTGGIKVEAEGDARVLGRVVLGDGVQGLGQGGSGEDDKLDALAGSLGSSCGRGSAGNRAAAGGQGSGNTGGTGRSQKVTAGNEIGFHRFTPCFCKKSLIIDVHVSASRSGTAIYLRAHSPSRPAAMRTPCSRLGRMYSRFSFTAFGLPGRLTMSVLPRNTLAARLSIPRGVMERLW